MKERGGRQPRPVEVVFLRAPGRPSRGQPGLRVSPATCSLLATPCHALSVACTALKLCSAATYWGDPSPLSLGTTSALVRASLSCNNCSTCCPRVAVVSGGRGPVAYTRQCLRPLPRAWLPDAYAHLMPMNLWVITGTCFLMGNLHLYGYM